MARTYRRFSPADEDEIWARLRAGHGAKPTARALGWSTSGVRGYLERCGGIRPASLRGWDVLLRRSVVRSQHMAGAGGIGLGGPTRKRGRGLGVGRCASWQPIRCCVPSWVTS